MNPDSAKTDAIAGRRIQKIRWAGIGFAALSFVYVVLAWVFMPSFFPGFPKAVVWPLVLLLILYCTKKILAGNDSWIKTLAVLSALRIAGSTSLILGGDYLPVVPYFLPCFILMFYLLGRAAWNWP